MTRPDQAPAREPRPARRTSSGPLLVVAAVFVVLVGPLPVAPAGALYQAVPLLSAAAIMHGVRRWRPRHPGGWRLLAAGMLLFSLLDAISNAYGLILHRPIPDPSAADVFYLAACLVLAWGLISLARAGCPSPAWGCSGPSSWWPPPLRRGDQLELLVTIAVMGALVTARVQSLQREREAAVALVGRSQARLDQLLRRSSDVIAVVTAVVTAEAGGNRHRDRHR